MKRYFSWEGGDKLKRQKVAEFRAKKIFVTNILICSKFFKNF